MRSSRTERRGLHLQRTRSGRPAGSGASLAPASAADAARSRRAGGDAQDSALYNCHCGYVFEAPVSTGVGCPHCGDTQAW